MFLTTVATFKDVTNGIEACQIPVEENVTATGAPSSFKYTKTNIPGQSYNQDKFLEQFAGCSCKGACTLEHCSCLQLFGSAYEGDGRISGKVFEGDTTRPVLECGHNCSCSRDFCGNRVVQKGIRYQLSVFPIAGKGYGLRLSKYVDITVTRGSFICEYAGEVVEHEEAQLRVKHTETRGQDNYLIALREHIDGKETCIYIDPRLIGNIGRFINHSCDPNLIMVPVRVNHQIPRLALFARKDIMPGEELTFDYSGQAAWDFTTAIHVNAAPLISVHINTNRFKMIDNVMDNSASPDSEGSLKRGVSSNCIDMSLSNKKAKVSTWTPTCQIHLSSDRASHKQTDASHEPTNRSSSSCKTVRNLECVDNRLSSDKIHEDSDKLAQTMAYDSVLRRAVDAKNMLFYGLSAVDNEVGSRHKRKPCYCNSSNCSGFLPFDDRLLNDD